MSCNNRGCGCRCGCGNRDVGGVEDRRCGRIGGVEDRRCGEVGGVEDRDRDRCRRKCCVCYLVEPITNFVRCVARSIGGCDCDRRR